MTTLPVCQTLLLEPHNGVLHITLNRPDSRNAMSLQMVKELRAVLAAVRDDQTTRALVIGGAGGHFCAGGDIKDMAGARARSQGEGRGDAYRELNRAFGAMLEEFQQASQVVIALLEGAVLGGGFGLACVSDVAITASGAKFGLPEVTLGLLPGGGGIVRMVRLLGLQTALPLLMEGRQFGVAQAQALGLIHDTAENEQELLDKADRKSVV